MLQSILLILGLAALAPWAHRLAGRWTGLLVGLVSAGVFVFFALGAGDIVSGEATLQRYEWIDALGAAISFRLDGLSLLFALLVTGVGALVAVYAGAYLKGHPRLVEFFASLLFFEGAMLGLVLADNIVCLFVFWELTSVSSFLLIGFERQRDAARRGALQALIVTGLGGMALLAGLTMLGTAAGTWDLTGIIGAGEAIRGHGLYAPALALVCIGAFTKSAQFPFHFWLPNAMEAPTPVSAYLHSSTMVKAGVYLLARLHPAMGGDPAWTHTLTIVGGVTYALGALLATRETSLKRALALTTVSGLGALVLMLGIGTGAAMISMALFLITHALYKGALFLVAGIIDVSAGEKQVDRLGGLRHRLPLTAGASMLAALSMAGVPPLLGYISKERALETALHQALGWWIVVLAVAGSSLTVAAAGIVGVGPFVGGAKQASRSGRDPGLAMLAGPVILALLGVVGGVAPGLFVGDLVSAAAGAALGAPIEAHLHFWSGFTPALGLAALAVVVGGVVWLLAARWRAALSPLGPLARFGPDNLYTVGLAVLQVGAVAVTRLVQNGRLRWYLIAVFLFTAGVAGVSLVELGALRGITSVGRVYAFDAIVCLTIVAGAIGATRARGRLGAVASLGVVGYGVTVLYVLYGAPDLALTQVAVETLTVILFVLVLYHLPRFAVYTGRVARARDLVIASVFGALMTLLTLLAADAQVAPSISDWFVRNSVPLGKGHNIVNVILVDFRALDTLGEITVLGVAAVGVYALLRLRPVARGGDDA